MGATRVTLCELPGSGQRAFVGGTWSPDGERIVFSSGQRLYEIPSRGGQPQLLFDASDSPGPDCRPPSFLTHRRRVSRPGVCSGSAHGRSSMLAVMGLETGERREVGSRRCGSFYSQTVT